MQDHHQLPQLSASSRPTGTADSVGTCGIVASPVSQPCEGAVIGDDYVRMLLHTIREHDAEKLSLLDRIEECVKPERAETQRLRRELNQKNGEIAQLHQDLSESRLMLQEERERSNRLLHENTVLHARLDDDRERIASFLRQRQQAKSAVVVDAREEDTIPDGRRHSSHGGNEKWSSIPVSGRSALGSSSNQKTHRESHGAGGATMSLRQAVRAQEKSAGENDLKLETNPAFYEILLQPSQSSAITTALSEEVRMLQEQLDAQRAAYESERTKRVHTERELTRQHAEEVERYITTIDQLETLQQKSLSDLIRTRHDMQIEQRELRGTVEKLRVSLEETLTVLENDRRRHFADLQQVRRRAGDNADTIMRKLRQELGECRAVSMAEKEQFTALLAERESEIEKLRETLKREKARQRRLEERHRLEFEGVNSEVSLMRQALRAMEKRVYYSQCRSISVGD